MSDHINTTDTEVAQTVIDTTGNTIYSVVPVRIPNDKSYAIMQLRDGDNIVLEGLLHNSQTGHEDGKSFIAGLETGVSEVDVVVRKTEKGFSLSSRGAKSVAARQAREAAAVIRDFKLSSIEVGTEFLGKVARVEKYGVFVEFGDELTGLLHNSKMAPAQVDTLKVGDTVVVYLDEVKEQRASLTTLTADQMRVIKSLRQPGTRVGGVVTKANKGGITILVGARVVTNEETSETSIEGGVVETWLSSNVVGRRPVSEGRELGFKVKVVSFDRGRLIVGV